MHDDEHASLLGQNVDRLTLQVEIYLALLLVSLNRHLSDSTCGLSDFTRVT